MCRLLTMNAFSACDRSRHGKLETGCKIHEIKLKFCKAFFCYSPTVNSYKKKMVENWLPKWTVDCY